MKRSVQLGTRYSVLGTQYWVRSALPVLSVLLFTSTLLAQTAAPTSSSSPTSHGPSSIDVPTLLFVFLLATFIGLGVITRVSRLLHTPLMSLTNAISAIAVVGAIGIAGAETKPAHPLYLTILGSIALFASMTNIVSGFLLTDRMVKMFKSQEGGKP